MVDIKNIKKNSRFYKACVIFERGIVSQFTDGIEKAALSYSSYT